jgi:hypothetical protein
MICFALSRLDGTLVRSGIMVERKLMEPVSKAESEQRYSHDGNPPFRV